MIHPLNPKSSSCNLCCTKIENFGIRYGNLQVLENVNLHIHCGEITAIIGPNGAGKSSLLKAILGEVKHTGHLNFVDAKNNHSGHPIIGYVPQYFEFEKSSPISVLDLFMMCKTNKPICFFRSKHIRKDVELLLSKVSADHLINKRLGNLSGGELQRIILALALLPIPDLLLLDEPVSGIDIKGLNIFYNLVSSIREKYDLSIILISHDLDVVSKYADRIVLLNKTVRYCGTPKDIFNDPNYKEIFGK